MTMAGRDIAARDISVRDMGGGDVGAVDALLRAAFPNEDEALLVARLCQDGDMVLALAADDQNGALAGMVAFSRMDVRVAGRAVSAVALAPLAVDPRFRGRGVADALVRAGLERLESAGVILCFVLGEPDLYRRFGFDPALAQGYESPYAGKYFMAAALQGGLIPCGERDVAHHASAFARLGSSA